MNQNVELEPVAERHAPVIQTLATSHPDIVKFTRLPDPYPENGAKEWIQIAVPQHKDGKEYSFAVKNKTNEVVGVCGLIVNEKENEAELGYWIGYEFWNQGYATAAIHEALKYAFQNENFDRVFALPLKRNKGSCIVLEKNGFRHIETRQNTNPKWKETDQISVYEITSKKWEKNFI
jgi:RimJ/RimL family protein N-acetyltransferase